MSPPPDEWPVARADARHAAVTDAVGPVSGPDVDSAVPTRRWTLQTDDTVSAEPVVGDGRAFVATNDGTLLAVTLDDGEVVWSANVPNRGPTPTVVDGICYAGAHGEPEITVGDISVGGGEFGADTLYAFDAEMGVPLRSGDPGAEVWTPLVSTGDGGLCYGSDDGSLVCADRESFDRRWRAAFSESITTAPAVTDDLVLAGDYDGNLRAFDADDGSELWNQSLDPMFRSDDPPQILGLAVGESGLGYCWTGDSRLRAVDLSTGEVRWTEPRTLGSPAVTAEAVVTLRTGADDELVVAVDPETGEEHWSFASPEYVTTDARPVVADGTVFACGSRGSESRSALLALDAVDGTCRWELDAFDSVSSSPVVVSNRLLLGVDDAVTMVGENE